MTGFNRKLIEKYVPGYWYREPENGWSVNDVVNTKAQINKEENKNTLFIAMDSETWHKGSGNRGIYAGWEDTHKKVKSFEHEIEGFIGQYPITELNSRIPQYITENPYDAIKRLADCSYERFSGDMIAITGTAGKSTVKSMFDFILSKYYSTIATKGNHNTRTGIPLTIANAVTNPDYLIIESAISALWIRPHGVMKRYPAQIAMVTSIDGGQRKDAYQTAVLKSKVAEGMDNKGSVLLNKDMNYFDTVRETIAEYNSNIITYGFDDHADNYVIKYEEQKIGSEITASIQGEILSFKTLLNGKAMVQNIIGVLTAIKLLNIPLDKVLPHISEYKPNKSVQNFEDYKTFSNKKFTVLDDNWNAMGISMIEAINVVKDKSKYYKGKKIAILGRIIDLDDKEAKRQHAVLAQYILDAEIDMVFAHGEEMKHALKLLPENLIGGYFDSSKDLAECVANIIEEDDLILIKGSIRASNFAHVKNYLLKFASEKPKKLEYTIDNRISKGYGAATFNLKTGEIAGTAGDIYASQNQGLGGIILTDYILDEIFSNNYDLTDLYEPDKQSIDESKAPKALELANGESVSLKTLVDGAVIQQSPNALLMMANKVIGSNQQAMNKIAEKVSELNLNDNSALNITGRRIKGQHQILTLHDMYTVSKNLFEKPPFIMDLLSQTNSVHNSKIIRTKSNLFSYGKITHGIFFGHLESLGLVLSENNGVRYVTAVLGARDPYHRDQLILESIKSSESKIEVQSNYQLAEKVDKDDFKINILGDTYFGEFYTDKRIKKGVQDSLMTEGRAYSFDGIRTLFSSGDMNIINFEATISSNHINLLSKRKPFVLYSDLNETVPALAKENVHLVTLGNNHIMDCGPESLSDTLTAFNKSEIITMGAGTRQEEAEKYLVKYVNGTRIAIFNGYWYRNGMYREFDFYAIGDQPGSACLSGNVMQQMKKEKQKHPDGKIILIAHWGVDFKKVNITQRKYAHSLVRAGADLIIGHGAHMIQEIESYKNSLIVYSIGNGVFNSNGEYNRRFVPPYSMLAQLQFSKKEIELKLYPIYSNNLKTYWQPRPLNEVEFTHCTTMLKAYGSTELNISSDNKNIRYYTFRI